MQNRWGSQSEPRKVRTAVVGCGKIADAHLTALQAVDSVEIVAAVDIEPWAAVQAAARYQVPLALSSIDELIEVAKPDVVHVTAPPQTHLPLATQLLENGCDLYIEKPFAVDRVETSTILATANALQRTVCPGFDLLFEPAWLTLWSQRGRLGEVRHLDLLFGHPLTGAYGREVQSDPEHWVWSLPAQFLQNVVVHPLYLMLAWLDDPTTIDYCVCEREPSSLAAPTRLRLGLKSPSATADLLFSARIRPQKRVRVFGTLGEAHLDLDTQVVTFSRAPALPGVAGRLESMLRAGAQTGAALARGAVHFGKGELQPLAGLNGLVHAFHRSIVKGTRPPVRDDLVLRTAKLMDDIIESYTRAARSPIRPQVTGPQ
jgi:predicted dehydrogenase